MAWAGGMACARDGRWQGPQGPTGKGDSRDSRRKGMAVTSRWGRTTGVGVLCALALCAIFASAASAVEYNMKMIPEIGRCEKVVKGTGEFSAASCVGSVA